MEVLVARKHLDMSTYIRDPEQLFERRRYVKGEEPAGAVHNPDDVRGKYLKCDLAQGKPLLAEILVGEFVQGIPSNPPGPRAVGISFSTYPGVEQIVPGKHVDIFWQRQNSEEKQRILVKNVRVLATGDQNDAKPGHRLVTLALTPEDCMKVTLVRGYGTLQVVLHQARDGEK